MVPFLRFVFFFEMKLGDFTNLFATGILGLLNSSGFFTLKKLKGKFFKTVNVQKQSSFSLFLQEKDNNENKI